MLNTLQVQGDQSDVSLRVAPLLVCGTGTRGETREFARAPRMAARCVYHVCVLRIVISRPTNFPSVNLLSHGGWSPRVVRSG